MPHKNRLLSISQPHIDPAALPTKSRWLARLQKLNHFTYPGATPLWLRLLFDLAALAWISWFAHRHAGFLLRNDLYLYGDHPGQFYRLWQLLAVTWPEEGRLIGWSPYWHAGWPEMQFYPPGFALAGWLIWLGSFQQLPPFAVYQILVFASFVLPAIGLYALMTWGLGDRLAGLVTAWLAMTAPLALGGVLGVMIGLLGDRLAFGLVPLLILSGLWLIRARRKTLAWFITSFFLACILLLHPFQAILPTLILGIYICLKGQGWRTQLHWLVLAILPAFGLSAFWWLPLILRRHAYIPLIEAPLLEIQTNLEALPWFNGIGWLLAIAILSSLFRPKERRWLATAIFLCGVGLLGFIFFDYQILVEKLNIYAIDPVRLISGVTFVLFVGVGLGLAELAWLDVRLLQRWGWGAFGLPLLLIVPWLIYGQIAQDYNFSKWMRKWQPAPGRTPLFLSQAEARYNLPAVWEVMAATPGRVLFTSHYTLFFDVPTSLKAATPILSGSEILGGTFTTRSPVSSYLWLGQAHPPVLRGKVEHQDDKILAGIAWESMSDDFLFDLIRRFNVTLIATTATDIHARAFLDASAQFEPVWTNGLFTFYQATGYQPAWIEATNATASINRSGKTAADVQITDAAPGATLLVKMTYYDLWQAELNGRPLPIQADTHGLMSISLPPGSYTIHLRYKPGWPERLGDTISLATALGTAGVLIFHRRKSFL